MIALKTMFYNPADFASMDNPLLQWLLLIA
jgi:hypothetical protein